MRLRFGFAYIEYESIRDSCLMASLFNQFHTFPSSSFRTRMSLTAHSTGHTYKKRNSRKGSLDDFYITKPPPLHLTSHQVLIIHHPTTPFKDFVMWDHF